MLTWIREKFGTVVISIIVGFIAFVFIFFGVFNPRSTRGLHEGAVAGTVNGDMISISDFNREYSRKVEYFRKIMGDKVSEEQLRAFRLKGAVFQDLVRKKVISQQSIRQGLLASDEQIKETVKEIPAFQKDGKFDVPTYKAVLMANQYSAAGFEKMLREDLSVQLWERFFQHRAFVSQDEVRREFLITREKRKVKYVWITPEAGKKDVQLKPEEVKKYLEDANKLNLVKNRFESKKDSEYKGKKFEDVKEGIAKDLMVSEKFEEIKKANDKIAESVLSLYSENEGHSDRESTINTFLKSYQLNIKTSPMANRRELTIPGMGDPKELITDAFAKKSNIDPATGGKPKKYTLPGGILIAWLVESEAANLSQLESSTSELRKQVVTRKQYELYQGWLKGVTAAAKVDANPSVVGDEPG